MKHFHWKPSDGFNRLRRLKKVWSFQNRNPYCIKCNQYGHIGCLPENYNDEIIYIPVPQNKRKLVRKKKYQGEYQVLGFAVCIELNKKNQSWTKEDTLFLNKYLDHLSDYGLCFGGSIAWGHIEPERYKKKSCQIKIHNGHRRFVFDWFMSQKEVKSVKITKLFDSVYGSEHDFENWDLIGNKP